MKIIQQDQNSLRLRDSNILGYSIGTIFTIFGLFMTIKPTMFIQHPPLLMSLFFLATGIFVVCIAKVTTVSLDKTLDKLTITQKSLFSQQSQEYLLSSVKQLELQQNYRTDNHNRPGISYNLVFILNTGIAVPLNPLGSTNISVAGIPINTEQALGNKIAGFMGVPFVELRPPTLQETLTAITSKVSSPPPNSTL